MLPLACPNAGLGMNPQINNLNLQVIRSSKNIGSVRTKSCPMRDGRTARDQGGWLYHPYSV